jgi:3-hydroxybutyryl-CoA dehydrogenase
LSGLTAIRTIGIVGAGQMGNGIAHVCALAGFDVMLNDVSSERLEAGVKTIQRNMDERCINLVLSAASQIAPPWLQFGRMVSVQRVQ